MINPILVTTTRSDLVETTHRGACCVLHADGTVLFECGDCETPTYPRSSLKFVQVLPLLESGAIERYAITASEIALMCASHSSEPQHEHAVRALLAKVGLEERDLQCGTHSPIDERALAAILSDGRSVSAIHNNCSGKHAGFLALAKYLSTDITRYLAFDHPVQTLVREAVGDVYGTPQGVLHAGVDGCGAPNYAMPLKQMALGFAKLCDPQATFRTARQIAVAKMQEAILSHPWMVAGSSRFCTELMSAMEGSVIGKLGAAGIYCFGLPGKAIGAAVKMEDGTSGPQYTVVTELLKSMRVAPQAGRQKLERFARQAILDCRQQVVDIDNSPQTCAAYGKIILGTMNLRAFLDGRAREVHPVLDVAQHFAC